MINIISILKKIYEHRGKILVIAFVILLILFTRQCNSNKYIKHKAEQNEAFYKEEIQRHKTKDGRYESEKATLMATMNELRKDTSRLAKEVMKIKKEGGKPKTIIDTRIVYIDTGSVKNTITKLDKNKYSLDFDYNSDDKIIHITGKNYFFAEPYKISDDKLGLKLKSDKTYFDSIRVNLELVLGVKEEKGISRVFAKSNSPKVVFTKLDAVEVEDYFKNKYSDKNKKRIGIGPYIGFGATVGPNGFNYGPSLGIGIQYNLIRF